MFNAYIKRSLPNYGEVQEGVVFSEDLLWQGLPPLGSNSSRGVKGSFVVVNGIRIWIPTGWDTMVEDNEGGCYSMSIKPTAWAAVHRLSSLQLLHDSSEVSKIQAALQKSLLSGLNGRHIRLTIEDRSGLPVFASAADHASAVVRNFVNEARSVYLSQRRLQWEEYAPHLICWANAKTGQRVTFSGKSAECFSFGEKDYVVTPRIGTVKDMKSSIREVAAESALDALRVVEADSDIIPPILPNLDHIATVSLRQADGRRQHYSFVIGYSGATSFTLTFQSAAQVHAVLDTSNPTLWELDWMGGWLDVASSIAPSLAEIDAASTTNVPTDSDDDGPPPLIGGSADVKCEIKPISMADINSVRLEATHSIRIPLSSGITHEVPPLGELTHLGGIESFSVLQCVMPVPAPWRRFDQPFLPLVKMEGLKWKPAAQFAVQSHEMGHSFAVFYLGCRRSASLSTLETFVDQSRVLSQRQVQHPSGDGVIIYEYTLGIEDQRTLPGSRSMCIRQRADGTVLALVAVPLLPSTTHDSVALETMPPAALAAVLQSTTYTVDDPVSVLSVPPFASLARTYELTETKTRKLKSHIREFRQQHPEVVVLEKPPPVYQLDLGGVLFQLPCGWSSQPPTIPGDFTHSSIIIPQDWAQTAAPPCSIADGRTHIADGFVAERGLSSVDSTSCWEAGRYVGEQGPIGSCEIFIADGRSLSDLMEVVRTSCSEGECDRSGKVCSLSLIGETSECDGCVSFVCRVAGSSAIAYFWGRSFDSKAVVMLTIVFAQGHFSAVKKKVEADVFPNVRRA